MIMRPNWAKGAVPTPRGWMKGNELLKAVRFTQAQIDEWHAAQNPAKPAPAPKKSQSKLEAMSKKELDEYALGKQKMVKNFLSKLSMK